MRSPTPSPHNLPLTIADREQEMIGLVFHRGEEVE